MLKNQVITTRVQLTNTVEEGTGSPSFAAKPSAVAFRQFASHCFVLKTNQGRRFSNAEELIAIANSNTFELNDTLHRARYTTYTTHGKVCACFRGFKTLSVCVACLSLESQNRMRFANVFLGFAIIFTKTIILMISSYSTCLFLLRQSRPNRSNRSPRWTCFWMSLIATHRTLIAGRSIASLLPVWIAK